MTISERYIYKIQSLYGLSEETVKKMHAGAAEIDKVFDPYAWNDIEAAINNRYLHNDKSRPRIGQVLVVLQEWERHGEITRNVPIEDAPRSTFPRTNILDISVTFSRLMDIMVECGIVAPEFPTNRPKGTLKSLVDMEGKLIISPRQWLQWKISDAKSACSAAFSKYKALNFWEQVAIGIDAGQIKFRVRDWGKVGAAATSSEIAGAMAIAREYIGGR